MSNFLSLSRRQTRSSAAALGSSGVVRLGLAHLRLSHLALTHGGTLGGTLGSGNNFVCALSLDALDVLLVLNLLLDVLVSLEDLVVFDLTHLQSLVHLGLQLLLEGGHFVALLLHKVGL